LRSNTFTAREDAVLSNGFYAWRRFDDGQKWPYLIGLDDLEPLAYAGIWECWERDGQILESFSILTTTPNELMVRIHDRMPVILAPFDWHTWLDPQASTRTLERLCVPYPARGMDAFLVSPKVGSVKASGLELLEPLG
jgi:putative SOS response-associated peptidase YedK